MSNNVVNATADIPDGLYDLLKGVTIAVLRERPVDLYSFVSDYFLKVNIVFPMSVYTCVWWYLCLPSIANLVVDMHLPISSLID